MGPDDAGGDASPTLQSRLEAADPPGDAESTRVANPAAPTIRDPVALLRHLDGSGQFHRDSRLGRIYHRGKVSLRENVAEDSLHVVVDGNRLAAHVDGVSPLAVRSHGRSGYSVPRTVSHNLAGIVEDVGSLLRGREGEHRCELNCEWHSSETEDERLLDPTASAWSVHLEARVSGMLDERRLGAALSAALGRHGERAPVEVVACRDDDELDAARARLQSTVVSIDERPPLRVHLARHPAGDVVMLNLNHAAGDGFAAVQVMHSIARAYGGDAGDPLDFLAGRDLPVRPTSASASVPARSSKRVVERLRNMLARPAQLAVDDPADHPGYGFLLAGLTTEETRRVVGDGPSATSRNVLLAALHLAIGAWNREHDAPRRRIAVLVATDLRPAAWRQDIVGNFSVTARVSTSRRERAGPASALKAIAAQTARNKRRRTGTALIAGLERAGMLPLWAKQSIVVLQPLTANRLVDTAMLCDLGAVEEAPSFGPGTGETAELWFSAPARAPLSLCVGAVTTQGRLRLTFRYPHRLFSPAAARRFADCYLDHVRSVAGTPFTHPPR